MSIFRLSLLRMCKLHVIKTPTVPLNVFHKLYISSFMGRLDGHNGLIVDSKLNQCNNIADFTERLEASLEQWVKNKLCGVWFNVYTSNAEWIPILSEKGFKIHHAKDNTISLYLWLPKEKNCKIPPYAHNMIGAGALVMNENNQILVVKESYQAIWKIPGGYVNPGEEISEAAQREVFEETGIKTKFISLLAFRHFPIGQFGCSDIYFIVRLKPLSCDIAKQDDEVIDCKWMDIKEFIRDSEVPSTLRKYIKKSVDSENKGVFMVQKIAHHPLSKNQQFIYFLSQDRPTNS